MAGPAGLMRSFTWVMSLNGFYQRKWHDFNIKLCVRVRVQAILQGHQRATLSITSALLSLAQCTERTKQCVPASKNHTNKNPICFLSASSEFISKHFLLMAAARRLVYRSYDGLVLLPDRTCQSKAVLEHKGHVWSFKILERWKHIINCA